MIDPSALHRLSHPLALPTPEEMAQADLAAGREHGGIARLMENAGRAVARAARTRLRPCRVLVLCGPGNNGGDGAVAARHLAQAGWPVAVAWLRAPKAGSAAADAATRWRGPVVPFRPEEASRADLVVDAVLGAGIDRDLDGIALETLKAARRVLAIDVPSGLDGATGAVRGWAPRAELTVTFVRAKPGHRLLPGGELLGELVVADIGLPPSVGDQVAVRCWHNHPGLWRLPEVGAESNKYGRGVVSICGGGVMPGATRLAADGARRAGAGLLRIAAEHGADLFRATEPGLIVDQAPLAELLQDHRRRTWVCGPGLTVPEVEASLPLLLGAGRQVVADAGALAAAGDRPERLRGVAVITPHAGEFKRLFGDPGPDRPSAVRAAARRLDAVVVSKGADTLVASPDGRLAINTHATPALATGGTGDVLSGVIAALLAAGMEAWEAAAAGVWLHGDAGLRAGVGLLAEDLPRHLGAATVAARTGSGEGRGSVTLARRARAG
ncbi:NAD(P)H-hydrate dehydratase [Rhizosaccharibacter radicis]|uniref:Bifunctional NAD(P)H-hydrate repair enzyme n=1 Tax=Rhizosaccharibacter radicis TaxID=2782605 RepID=A0ABT1VYI6_9PROT|nr:NAD(P)H-hydrate dehydratase [Acetobacteraceae bacterium KSS12]